MPNLAVRNIPASVYKSLQRSAKRNGRSLVGMALELAVRFGRSVYDCLYLGLAQQVPCEFVTADRRLFNAVQSHLPGVRLLADLA